MFAGGQHRDHDVGARRGLGRRFAPPATPSARACVEGGGDQVEAANRVTRP